jgi:hypothetical protein
VGHAPVAQCGAGPRNRSTHFFRQQAKGFMEVFARSGRPVVTQALPWLRSRRHRHRLSSTPPQEFFMQVVDATWVERFARRLMQLLPSKHPLDAVRSASETFADSSHLPPEVAAEFYVIEPPPLDSGAEQVTPPRRPARRPTA